MTISQVLKDLIDYVLNPLFAVLVDLGFDIDIIIVSGFSYKGLITLVVTLFTWFVFVYAVIKFFGFILTIFLKGFNFQ